MEVISIKNINILDIIQLNSCSNLLLCNYNDQKYCYKEILCDREIILNNLMQFNDISAKGLLLPSYYICDSKNRLIGYLTKYIDSSTDFSDLSDYGESEKIRILNDTKESLEKLRAFNIVHGDLHPKNYLLDENNNPYIIDFDYSNNTYFNRHIVSASRKFVEKNGYSCEVDKYIFNIVTYSVLNDISFNNAIWNIYTGNRSKYDNKSVVKELKNVKNKVKCKNYLIDLI